MTGADSTANAAAPLFPPLATSIVVPVTSISPPLAAARSRARAGAGRAPTMSTRATAITRTIATSVTTGRGGSGSSSSRRRWCATGGCGYGCCRLALGRSRTHAAPIRLTSASTTPSFREHRRTGRITDRRPSSSGSGIGGDTVTARQWRIRAAATTTTHRNGKSARARERERDLPPGAEHRHGREQRRRTHLGADR